MKMQLWIVVALATFLAAFSQANASGKEVSKDQVPKAVLEAFEKAYPNAKKVEFEKEMFEGKEAYEVEYKENGKEYEILYSSEGEVLQKEETIDVKELPESIVQAISKVHPKATIKEAEKLMKPDGTVTGYEVEIKEDGKKLELELDANGNILKTEQD
ncbi:PepSY domain-containing protein [Nitrosomonas communis]|uniref:Putative beta-lactamase-inhibitor-like, PepSY-like n=1 Tax=Nitrosomonas communis TaxID=44574 RepID=A0A1H2YB99_9PROT|nr:PepSY-like domain-containing protein [Nitrosomonas communis]SDX02235.1 Putative beta-lactamase-inhibitor-like, PepSY-like [Nitrosomonas communis]